jgi:hypothetical protein
MAHAICGSFTSVVQQSLEVQWHSNRTKVLPLASEEEFSSPAVVHENYCVDRLSRRRSSGLIHLAIVVGALGLDRNDFSRGVGRLPTAALTAQDISPCFSLGAHWEPVLGPTEDTVYLSDLSFS